MYQQDETYTVGEIADFLAIVPQNIPQEIKSYTHWVVWKSAAREDGTVDKVPYSPITKRRASHSDSRSWGTFGEALEAYEGGFGDGLGFVLSSGDPYTVIDLDGVRDPETKELSEWALEVIEALDGHNEVSPSGEGVHVWIKGGLRTKEGKKRGGLEAYSMKRFITVTGVTL